MFELNAVILRSCEPKTGKRYANAGQMLEELRTLAAGLSLRYSPSRMRARRAVFAAKPIAMGSSAVTFDGIAAPFRVTDESTIVGYVRPMAKSTAPSKSGTISAFRPPETTFTPARADWWLGA